MKIHIDKEEAIRLLNERLFEINSWEFDPKVWKDRTILDLKQIFGNLSDQWLQVYGIYFDTAITSQKEAKLKEGKETARKLLNSYIDYINRFSEIQAKEQKKIEDSYKQKYDELLNEWNQFVPDYNQILKDHESILDENKSLIEKIKELELQQTEEQLTEELFSFEIIEKTRGYLENVAKQAMICYQKGLFDACLVMLRKLIEALIIEAYESHGIESNIKDGNGNYFYLSTLLEKLVNESTWTITRNSIQASPRIKKFADLSAHNRRFNAKRKDIEEIKDDVRILIEELVHLSKLK